MAGVIDLRGGDQNPWAQFLPKMFQQMMIMSIKSKYDIEKLKQTQINKISDEQRGEQKDLRQKGFTEVPAELSEQDFENVGQAGGPPAQVGGKTFIPPKIPQEEGWRYNPSKQEVFYTKPDKPEKPPSTAIAAYLDKNPNATTEQIAEYSRSLRATKEDPTPSLQRRIRYIERNGKVFAQEYNFNPKTGAEELKGGEYESKVPGEVTITQSIPAKVAEQTAKDVAKIKTRIQSPQFRSDVIDSVKKGKGTDFEILSESGKKLEFRKEADRQMRDTYGSDIVWDIKKGVLGWYDKNGKLIRRWVD